MRSSVGGRKRKVPISQGYWIGAQLAQRTPRRKSRLRSVASRTSAVSCRVGSAHRCKARDGGPSLRYGPRRGRETRAERRPAHVVTTVEVAGVRQEAAKSAR